MSSDEDDFNNGNNVGGSESEDEGLYAFKRNRNCNYHKVTHFIIKKKYLHQTDYYLHFSQSRNILVTGRGCRRRSMGKLIKNIGLH